MDTISLMEQILSKDNLNAAYLQVVRNKGAAGVDGMAVEELGGYLSENGESIKEKLRTRKYKPQPVRRVEIPKPDGGIRNLGVPTVVDRFVQQAVAQVLTPIFEEQFHNHSYGFRPNRCAQQAVLKALEMMNDGHSWIVDIDLAKFFDTVDHDKLMTIFGRTIKDGDVISVVRKFLVSGVMIVNAEKSKVDKPKGIKYLGFGFYFDSFAKGYKARPHPKAAAKFKAQMKKLTCRSWGADNDYKVKKLNQLIRGWINYFKIGNMKGLCERLDSQIRYRLRMCIWKHWKTPQNRAKNLIKLGISRKYAWTTAYTGARIAYICQRGAMNMAVTKERLTRFGLVSMVDYYAKRRVTC